MSGFRVWVDGMDSAIMFTDADPNGLTVFPTLSQAKAHVVTELRSQRRWLLEATQRISELRLADLEHDLGIHPLDR